MMITKATLLPPGSALPSDRTATKKASGNAWEPRPANGTANHTKPTASQLSSFKTAAIAEVDAGYPSGVPAYEAMVNRVSGGFTGTTDQIIRWAAWKWGWDEDVLRALCCQESWWKQDAVGDNGLSFGITQVKKTTKVGTYPMSELSTAFNLDFCGLVLRATYEGTYPWLMLAETRGDEWGAIGSWNSGQYCDDLALAYVSNVENYLNEKPWTQSGF